MNLVLFSTRAAALVLPRILGFIRSPTDVYTTDKMSVSDILSDIDDLRKLNGRVEVAQSIILCKTSLRLVDRLYTHGKAKALFIAQRMDSVNGLARICTAGMQESEGNHKSWNGCENLSSTSSLTLLLL